MTIQLIRRHGNRAIPLKTSAPIWTVVALLAGSATAGCRRSEPPPASASSSTAPSVASQKPPAIPKVGLYVTNEASGDVTVIDAATLTAVATIPVGKRPRGIAASPDGTRLYVALSGSPNAGPGVDEKTLPPPDRTADGIGIIDVRQGKLVKVVPSGTDPEQLAVSPDGTRVFVANEDAGRASIIDVASGKVIETFKTGDEPEGVSVEPSGDRVWVTSESDGAVVVYDLAKERTAGSVKVGPRPRSIAFLPDGSRAYVPSENGGTLTLIDARRLRPLKTIDLGTGMRPMGTKMSADGKQLYVTTGRSKMVLFLDTATNTIAGSVEAGARPWGLAVAPDGATLYTANGPSNDVSAIDVATRQVTRKIAVGRGPWGIAMVKAPPDARSGSY